MTTQVYPRHFVRLPSGPQGAPAFVGFEFSFFGPMVPQDVPAPAVPGGAGGLSAANSLALSATAATAQTVYTIQMKTPGQSFANIGTVTFAPASDVGVFNYTTTTYAADAYFQCVPPVSPDATLSGVVIFCRG